MTRGPKRDKGTPDAAVVAEVDDLEHEAAIDAAEADTSPPSADAYEIAGWFRELGGLSRAEQAERVRARQARRTPAPEPAPTSAQVRPVNPWDDDTARLARLSREELVRRLEAVPGRHIEPEALARLDHAGLVERLRGRGAR